MPVYQYRDPAGAIIELAKPVAERDDVPRGLVRITVPQRISIGGTSSSPIDPHTAAASVPKALKSLSNNEVNQMAREGGMTVDHFKKVWNM